MKRTLIRTDDQIRHISSRTKDHKSQKVAGEKRRGIRYIPVTAEARPSPSRHFGDTSGIDLYRDPEGKWSVVNDPDEFVEILISEARMRVKFESQTSRRGIPETVIRRDRSPIQNYTISFHPAVSDLLADQAKTGVDTTEQIRELIKRYLPVLEALFAGKRYILGLALHRDTDDIHFDVPVSRQGPQGRIGKAGLGLVGPFCVAVDRQIRSGARIGSEKRAQYARAVQKFRGRHGECVPFDVQLCRSLDEVSLIVFGPLLQSYIDAYAVRVPELERAHALTALDELERARAKILDTLQADTTLRRPTTIQRPSSTQNPETQYE